MTRSKLNASGSGVLVTFNVAKITLVPADQFRSVTAFFSSLISLYDTALNV